jgi:hypothetical protein
MAWNFSALAMAVVLAVAPLAMHAQQDSTQSDPPASPETGVELQGGGQWQINFTSPSEQSDPGVSSQWETTIPAPPDITVINVKPSKLESKADKAKAAAAAAAKKKLMQPAKPKSTPVGTPGGTSTQEQGQTQNWETEFLVDRQDHQFDRATARTEP